MSTADKSPVQAAFGAGPEIKLERVSERYFQLTAVKCKCGGQVLVQDFKNRASREMRYEAFCEDCLVCDSNGYSSRKKTVEGATRYFAPRQEERI